MAYHEHGNTSAYPQYPPQQQYQDNMDTAYNPYDNPQPHSGYDQSGYPYNNDSGYNAGYEAGYRDEPVPVASKEREKSVFEVAARAQPIGPKTSSAMRRWRYEHQGSLWARGSRGRCIGRFFCCTLMIFLFLLISIVLALALWIRPPNITIGQPTAPTNGSTIQAQNTGVTVNLGVDIAVNNPNYFSVNFNEIKADLIYPLGNTNIGGGSLKNVDIKSTAQTNFTFPVALTYTFSEDPNFAVLSDIASRCGVGSNPSPSDLTVDYKITLSFKVLFIPIKPVISNSFSFGCPISPDQINDLLKAAGISLNNIGAL